MSITRPLTYLMAAAAAALCAAVSGCGDREPPDAVPPSPSVQDDVESRLPPAIDQHDEAPTHAEHAAGGVAPIAEADDVPDGAGPASDAIGAGGVEPPIPEQPRRDLPDEATTEADRLYGMVLSAIVTPDGLVRYDRLQQPQLSRALEQAVELYGEAQQPTDVEARLALWMNAYNANVLAKVLDARRSASFESVIAVPGFFDADTITVAGETLTLNALENERIRPRGDARIHCGLVCAARSCPPLGREPFTADRLDRQLDRLCRAWVNEGDRFQRLGDTVGASAILGWYAEDFEGGRYTSPAEFIRAYAEPAAPLGRLLAEQDSPPLEFLEYDWSLNDASPRPREPRDVEPMK